MVDSISRLFGQSPIRPIQYHMQKVLDCVGMLADFVEAAHGGDWDAAARIQGTIGELERDADRMKDDLRASLPKSLLMPVARADVLALLSMQDKLANQAKDVAGQMLGRKMEVPEAIADEFKLFVGKSLDSARQALRAIEELDDLLETGFDKKEQAKVKVFTEEINRLESECDTIQVSIRANLMAIEESLPPVQVMFLYRVIETIAEISDIAHRVGNRLKIMLAK